MRTQRHFKFHFFKDTNKKKTCIRQYERIKTNVLFLVFERLHQVRCMYGIFFVSSFVQQDRKKILQNYIQKIFYISCTKKYNYEDLNIPLPDFLEVKYFFLVFQLKVIFWPDSSRYFITSVDHYINNFLYLQYAGPVEEIPCQNIPILRT